MGFAAHGECVGCARTGRQFDDEFCGAGGLAVGSEESNGDLHWRRCTGYNGVKTESLWTAQFAEDLRAARLIPQTFARRGRERPIRRREKSCRLKCRS